MTEASDVIPFAENVAAMIAEKCESLVNHLFNMNDFCQWQDAYTGFFIPCLWVSCYAVLSIEVVPDDEVIG